MSDIYSMTPGELRERAVHTTYMAYESLRAGGDWNEIGSRASLAAALFALANDRERHDVPPVYNESEHFSKYRKQSGDKILVECMCGQRFASCIPGGLFGKGSGDADEQHCNHRVDMKQKWRLSADVQHWGCCDGSCTS